MPNQTRIDKFKAMIRAKLDAKIKADEAIPKAPPPRYDEEYYKGVLWVDSLAYSPEETQALTFYTGGTDDKGRSLEEMLSWTDEQLETTHDYIQWMFPLPEPSEFNPTSPVLSQYEISVFNQNAGLREQLMLSIVRFTNFLENTSEKWNTKSDHNHLRISRMLRRMTLLGLGFHAKILLYKLIEKTKDRVNTESIGFWIEAANEDG